jgi:hypothetical protein
MKRKNHRQLGPNRECLIDLSGPNVTIKNINRANIFFYKVLTFFKQGINQNDLIVILLCAMCNAKIFQEVKLLVEHNFI